MNKTKISFIIVVVVVIIGVFFLFSGNKETTETESKTQPTSQSTDVVIDEGQTIVIQGHQLPRGDIEIEVGEFARQVVEQTGAVEPVDLDHGERVGQRVVDDDLWLDGKGRQPRFRFALGGDNLGHAYLTAE